ncbi:hypothetical protein RhiirC2_784780 [Rhizophagus irregularis]|uniref:F-box domain-containing protein n=1 Tax=Rhizophagus irregularis TaxID=588596 RepID=A0A2N1MXP7_9GLOM|nr:hypothetical protein RhiirC2_784780 [Rhizophagus irregularis]
MSRLKIFSGDLPEITSEVIKYFKNDFSTLHSCILVNRLWCRLAIPLLWENPFSIPTRNCKFIEIYLNNLNDDLKSKLNEYKIIDNLFSSSNTLFNYPGFLKYLSTRELIHTIERWFENVLIRNRIFKRDSEISNLRSLISISLFKIFIENEVKLHTLDIEVTDHLIHNSYLDDFLELILQKPNFIYNVSNLRLYIMNSSFEDNSKHTSIKNHISQIINSHQILKKMVLGHNKRFPLYQSLLLSKDYNCSNTLNTIVLYSINFDDINNLDKIFEQLNVLESVHIIYCSSLNTSFTQQIINLTKPLKLKSLFINEVSQIESLQLLLQNYGNYLENFGFGFGVGYGLSLTLFRQQLLELISKYCKNIKFLDIFEFEDQVTYSALNLIEDIKQNINYLSINVGPISTSYYKSGSIILRNLGQILPLELDYLSLTLNVDITDFEIFLKNSQNIFINKLLINNYGVHEILPYIKKYIMKEKRVKYLAISDAIYSKYTCFSDKYYFEYKDLFSLKDEVKEFELYNIKIQKYDDLVISSRLNLLNFIKRLD